MNTASLTLEYSPAPGVTRFVVHVGASRVLGRLDRNNLVGKWRAHSVGRTAEFGTKQDAVTWLAGR